MTAANASFELPPLPDYTLHPLPPLLSWISDAHLALALPVIAYWVVSGFFHFIDVYDLFPQYRLHTPAEILKRNPVTRWECFREVVLQHIIQTIFGIVMAWFDEEPTFGKDEYNVAWWAQNIRLAQRAVPVVLATAGLNPTALASNVAKTQPMLAAVITGGQNVGLVPAFTSWELRAAQAVYYVVIPALQFLAGIVLVDTWEYFLHRAMHMNKWLYVTLHSRHHRLYVPYAYGALYNHPVEGFLLDTLGTGLAYLAVGMTTRQSMWFFTGCTIKTVDDHCGYKLPFDPLQHITSNNAAYHDIHHQSWGIKSNFSQPFFTFWDRWGGTMWTGDVTARYERSRRTAEQKMEQDRAAEVDAKPADILSASGTDENARPTPISAPRSTRKKASSISQSSGNWKGLRNIVNDSLHGKGGNVLGVESSH